MSQMCYVGVKLPKLGKVPRLFEQHGVCYLLLAL